MSKKKIRKQVLEASRIAADAERDRLAYLQERESLPQQYREGALTQMAGAYGLTDDPAAQQAIINRAESSPLYGAIMGGMDESEEAILRRASATGGLRGGNVQGALAENAQQLENQALLQSYNQQMQGLQGLSSLPSLAPQIGQSMANVGDIEAQGKIGAMQSAQSASQSGFGNMMGLGQLGLQAYGAFGGGGGGGGGGGMFDFSDPRLKKNKKVIGIFGDLKVYSWDWNDLAAKLNLFGSDAGFMADEVEELYPAMVGESDGFKTVNYRGVYGF